MDFELATARRGEKVIVVGWELGVRDKTKEPMRTQARQLRRARAALLGRDAVLSDDLVAKIICSYTS
jgi:hypothetical protein